MSESQNNDGQSSRSRQRRGAHRSNNSSNGESWRALNSMVKSLTSILILGSFEFKDDYYYMPPLFQIDKQLQMVLRELREVQFSNSLQLQLIYRLTKVFMAVSVVPSPNDIPIFVVEKT